MFETINGTQTMWNGGGGDDDDDLPPLRPPYDLNARNVDAMPPPPSDTVQAVGGSSAGPSNLNDDGEADGPQQPTLEGAGAQGSLTRSASGLTIETMEAGTVRDSTVTELPRSAGGTAPGLYRRPYSGTSRGANTGTLLPSVSEDATPQQDDGDGEGAEHAAAEVGEAAMPRTPMGAATVAALLEGSQTQGASKASCMAAQDGAEPVDASNREWGKALGKTNSTLTGELART